MDLISVSQLAVWEKIGHIVCRLLWALQQQQQRRKMCRNNESKKKLWCLWSPTTTIFSIRLARSIMLVFSCMLVVCAWRFRFLSPYFGTHTRQLIACHWRLDNVCFSFLGHPHGIIQRFGQDGPITLHALLEHEFIATNHNTKWLDRCNSMKWTKKKKLKLFHCKCIFHVQTANRILSYTFRCSHRRCRRRRLQNKFKSLPCRTQFIRFQRMLTVRARNDKRPIRCCGLIIFFFCIWRAAERNWSGRKATTFAWDSLRT